MFCVDLCSGTEGLLPGDGSGKCGQHCVPLWQALVFQFLCESLCVRTPVHMEVRTRLHRDRDLEVRG